uniref:Vacuolar protein sortingassociated protein putative n=1 Tax=Albugo laibachii Nc14 TaxID=890382 RepID=F0WW33_9STRA|nr:vacuolar protein sortingassociated protein putative [Albugo laibachii Nc14]|eukprot:CCA25640.1 vacuolar protein sortingassociated protein putative [Albugo laibachii Nc14]
MATLEEIDFDELDDYLELFQQDDVIKEALMHGVDLRKYAEQIDHELRDAEIDSVSQFVMKSSDIVELYHQVQGCDDILARMQEILFGFQADLGGLSEEIRTLQEESVGMNLQMRNRQETEHRLNEYLDRVVMTPSLVRSIDEADINEDYIEKLIKLDSKLKYASQMKDAEEPNSADLMAPKETEMHLRNLKLRAVARIREFLLIRVNEMKKSKPNIQMLQQNSFLPKKYLVTFLAYHAPQIEEEFRDVYAETMSKILVHVMNSYHSGLMKYSQEVATKTDLIVVEEQSLKGIFTSKVNLNKRNDTLALNDRDKLLENSSASPLSLHVLESAHTQLPYEAVFCNVQQHLMNSATAEFLFIIDFFRGSSKEENVLRSRDLFLRIFAKTISLCLENLENYLFTCYDAIGLLLMIRLTHAHRLVMERRKIPCLDAYFDRITLLLWPRFKSVFDMNLASIRNAKVKKLGTIDLHPHYVVRRYAEFAASILKLSLDAQEPMSFRSTHSRSSTLPLISLSAEVVSTMDCELRENGVGRMLFNDLALLRDEVLHLLMRLADQQPNSKEKCVFLVNNYDFVVSAFHEKHLASEETSAFETLLTQQRERFVEEELALLYGDLIEFVRQNESIIVPSPQLSIHSNARDVAATNIVIEQDKVKRIIRNFNGSWKNGIERINANVMKYFSNFRNGMEILKLVLTQLLLYYTRFIEIAKKSWTRPPPYSNEIVTTQEILFEIKKYSRSF